jgi:hypothetical protein
MTAEIAILNREGVALAADSASSFAGGGPGATYKIFPSANKIWQLSRRHPVGIMIYHSATLLEVPWETVIGMYREERGDTAFPTLREHALDFMAYLASLQHVFTPAQQDEFAQINLERLFTRLRDSIRTQVRTAWGDQAGTLRSEAVAAIASRVVAEQRQRWAQALPAESLPADLRDAIRARYASLGERIRDRVFGTDAQPGTDGQMLPLEQAAREDLAALVADLYLLYSSDYTFNEASGVVIAGFGSRDVFPALEHFYVEGLVLDRVKYQVLESQQISYDARAGISPFAQAEMVTTFLQGVSPSYQQQVDAALLELVGALPDALPDDLPGVGDGLREALRARAADIAAKLVPAQLEKLRAHRRETYVDPALFVVSMLPRDELASLAESLVNLTSLRRRYSMDAETVGGPIDVAVISKADGFVWIKRKHYFQAALNPHAFRSTDLTARSSRETD